MIHVYDKRRVLTLLAVVALISGSLLAWRYGYVPEIGKFFAAEPGGEAVVGRPGFVYARNGKFMLDGREYYAKGVNMYNGLGYVSHFFQPNPAYEVYTPEAFWQEFDEQKISDAFQYWHDTLGMNTIRIFTPSYRRWDAEVKWHHWTPWFEGDGSVNPVMRDRLVSFVNLAHRNGIRVYITLLLHTAEMDWECRTGDIWELCLSQQTGVNRLGTVIDGADARLVEPGSDMEQKYFRYFGSLLPSLRDLPGVLGYEIGNEGLLKWPFNGRDVSPRRDWYQDKVGSEIVRLYRKIRELDPNHLIGTGEVTSYDPSQQSWWGWPSPEFGMLNDIHGLNGGVPYTLESVVDFIAPHLYNFTTVQGAEPADVVAAMRERTMKPLLLGEFGYVEGSPSPFSPPAPDAARQTYLQKIVQLGSAGAISGHLLWAPMPPVPLPPGGYTETTVGSGAPALRFTGPPERTIVGLDYTFALFGFDASYPNNQKPLPEAETVFGRVEPLKNEAAFVSQSVPALMRPGETVEVTVVFRNSGTRAWDKAGGPGDYLNAYRIKSQNPADNTTWSIGFVPIPSSLIRPGDSASFVFPITAPGEPGTYNFQWQMNQGGVGWFGDLSPNVSVVVTDEAPPAPTDTIVPTVPPGRVPGDANGDGKVNIFDYNLVVSNFGTDGKEIPGDLDGDGTVGIFDYNEVVSNFGT